MNCLQLKITSDDGFTLIEVIATVIVMSILAAFFIHFMGTAVDYSWEAVEFVEGEAAAEGMIEQIIADYVREMNSAPDSALATLVSNNSGGTYGGNVAMAYIGFDENGNEIPVTSGTSELLKVTAQASGNDLTIILPKSRWFPTDPIIEY
jgi:prepilin-type N-terminal cleavage/methylation domain-containing protein